MQHELRRLTLDDLETALEVYRACEDFLALGPVPTASPEMVRRDIRHSLASGGSYCGIFSPDGAILGVVDFLPQGFAGSPACAFIELLMISPPYRRHGLGQAVVRRVENEISRNPAVFWIYSAVQVNHPAAIQFWQSQDYTVSTAPEPQPDGTTTFRLSKRLSPTAR
jgi:ribosomal protein S18 acetylase RimI-like enzyme